MSSIDPSPRRRRRTALTAERIVEAAIAILDATGEESLTFRSLSDRLETGAGAIYHHLANKGEILQAATESIVRQRLTEGGDHRDAASGLRHLMDDLFTVIDSHPWVGTELSREPWQPAMAAVFLRVAEHLRELGVPESDLFGATSALTSLLLGVAAQYAAAGRLARESNREAFLRKISEDWRSEAQQSPLSNRLADQLAHHDDRRQFADSVELILSGITHTTHAEARADLR